MSPRYEVGDRIIYRAWDGEQRITIVSARYEDVKNGRPGFDGRLLGGPEDSAAVWGYDDQILATPSQPDGIR